MSDWMPCSECGCETYEATADELQGSVPPDALKEMRVAESFGARFLVCCVCSLIGEARLVSDDVNAPGGAS